jgi:hypothetical protein
MRLEDAFRIAASLGGSNVGWSYRVTLIIAGCWWVSTNNKRCSRRNYNECRREWGRGLRCVRHVRCNRIVIVAACAQYKKPQGPKQTSATRLPVGRRCLFSLPSTQKCAVPRYRGLALRSQSCSHTRTKRSRLRRVVDARITDGILRRSRWEKHSPRRRRGDGEED